MKAESNEPDFERRDSARQTYVALSRKQIATPKKKVENTIMSARSAVAYRGKTSRKTIAGSEKKRIEPKM